MGELNASLIPKLNFSLSSEFPASQQCLNSIPGYLKLTSFDLEGQTTRISKIPQSSAVSSLSFSPNSSQIAVASGNSVKIYDLSTFSEVFCYSHISAVNSVIFDNFSQLIASGSNDKLIKVIRINNQELQNELIGHSASINSVMFNRSSNLLVSGSSDNQILLWDLYNNTLESKLLGHTSGINQVIFNQDSSLLASASNCIKLWETDSRKELFTLTDFTFYYSLAFTSNSDFLAGGNSESEVKIWSLQSRSEIWKIKEFGSFVFSLCFTSDSKFLITGSADRKVKIWNLKEKREELELMRLEGKVYTVGVSVGGRFVACGGEDEFFKVCDC
jgi:WD40 repeat protein